MPNSLIVNCFLQLGENVNFFYICPWPVVWLESPEPGIKIFFRRNTVSPDFA
jgi:hypothetical protein